MQYFLVSQAPDAYLNLARDEYLLDNLPEGDRILYLYVNHRAVIIGRNQNPWRECNLNQLDADGVQLVRRVSGGGAVYHDEGNLNFSFICSENLYDEAEQTGVILSALSSMGIASSVTGRNDIEAEGRKFSGNAYCQRGKNRQRHGTLLVSSDLSVFDRYLNVPRQKLVAKGVTSVKSRVCNLSEISPGLAVPRVADALRNAYENRFGRAEEYRFTPEAETRVRALYEKHASWDWRMGEAPPFDYTYEHRFPWGMAQICLAVTGGKVARARVFTDALDISVPARVEPLLIGERFRGADLSKKLLACAGEARDIGEYLSGNLP